MQHEYFVSYARIPNNGGGFGFGQTVLPVTGPMTTEAIAKVHEVLQERNPSYLVVIISFQRLEAKPQTVSA